MGSGIPSFFRTPGHRKFEYRPVYYDQRKERRREMERLAKAENEGRSSDESELESFKDRLNQRWRSADRNIRTKASAQQRIRLLVIFAILAGLIWLFFNWS